MSKSPNKCKASQVEYDLMIVKKSIEINNDSKQLAKILTDNILFKIRRYMADLIIAASRNARLCAYDEMIYGTYKILVDYYCMSIKKYDECERMISNPKIKTIIDGIYSVLKSEMRNKEETINADGENPILLEKKAIVSQGLNYFAKATEGAADVFITGKLDTVQMDLIHAIAGNCRSNNCSEDSSNIWEIAKGIVEDVNTECFSIFNKFITDSIKFSVSNLNDLESRKTTNFYYELLEKEAEILSSIIKIQVMAVDKEKSGSASEKIAVNSMLSHLLEANQVLAKNMTEIKSCFNVSDSISNCDVKLSITPELTLGECFLSELNKIQDFRTKITNINDNIAGLKELLKCKLSTEIEEDLFGRHVRKKAYNFNLKVTQLVDMTNDMINAFKDILNHYEKNAENYTDGESLEIIKGICETISIKVECLDENRAYFRQSAELTLVGLKSCAVKVDENEFNSNEFYDEMSMVIKLIFDSKPNEFGDEKAVRKYIACIKSILLEVYKEKVKKYKEEFAKCTNVFDDKLEKQEFQFKKNYLLYEVTTFEEILNYSVTRIAEDSDTNVASFVEAIYSAVETVEIALKKNGIIKISPEPHHLFNSKEHEVLMVENNPEFKKGEVIKLMNSGYKQNDLVIIRANIIAAK